MKKLMWLNIILLIVFSIIFIIGIYSLSFGTQSIDNNVNDLIFYRADNDIIKSDTYLKYIMIQRIVYGGILSAIGGAGVLMSLNWFLKIKTTKGEEVK